MKTSKRLGTGAGAVLLLGALAAACLGGEVPVGGAGGPGAGSTGVAGPPSTQLVSGGAVVTSSNYKMAFTLGQPTQNQNKTTSPSYRMQGGLIGANGTLP